MKPNIAVLRAEALNPLYLGDEAEKRDFRYAVSSVFFLMCSFFKYLSARFVLVDYFSKLVCVVYLILKQKFEKNVESSKSSTKNLNFI